MANSLFLDALTCLNTGERPPCWLMRQSGRYLPDYQKIRTLISFEELCKDAALIEEATLIPLSYFDLDALIIFSDILLLLESFGYPFTFIEGKGPFLEKSFRKETPLKMHKPEVLDPLFQAIRSVKQRSALPLLGFAGAPLTLFFYLLEGASPKNNHALLNLMWNQTELFQQIMGSLTEGIISLLEAESIAGVDAVQIFDTWADLIPLADYVEYCLPYMQKISSYLHEKHIPHLFFLKNATGLIPYFKEIRPSGLSLGSGVCLQNIRRSIGSRIALQGNIDSQTLFAPPAILKNRCKELLKKMAQDPGFIFNLGHGIQPHTPIDNVKIMIECIKEGCLI